MATLVATSLWLLPAARARAQTSDTAAALKWLVPPLLPPGALLAVVSGDPTAPGVCTMELIMPDGATGSRHTTIRTTSTSKSGRER